MRGCLAVLAMAVLAVVIGVWFGGPPIAEQVVRIGLGSTGLHSDDLDVAVRSDPPLELALGRADHVVVTGTNVAWNGHHVDTLRLTLDDVDLLGRSAGRTSGRLDGVELAGVEPPGSKASVVVAGRGPVLGVTIVIDGATAEAMASAAFEHKTGTRPTSVTFSAPNIVRLKAGPLEATGTLTIGPDGSLGLTTQQGRVLVLEPGASQPIDLKSVSIAGDTVVLSGTVKVADLIG